MVLPYWEYAKFSPQQLVLFLSGLQVPQALVHSSNDDADDNGFYGNGAALH